jgi:hypothetical protein
MDSDHQSNELIGRVLCLKLKNTFEHIALDPILYTMRTLILRSTMINDHDHQTRAEIIEAELKECLKRMMKRVESGDFEFVLQNISYSKAHYSFNRYADILHKFTGINASNKHLLFWSTLAEI